MEKEEHNFQKRFRSIPWLVCTKCGLVRLRNPFTDWCVRQGCNAEDHPQYEQIKKQLTRQEELT